MFSAFMIVALVIALVFALSSGGKDFRKDMPPEMRKAWFEKEFHRIKKPR